MKIHDTGQSFIHAIFANTIVRPIKRFLRYLIVRFGLPQAKLDVETINKSGLAKPDFYCPPHWQNQNLDDSIRWYVRSWSRSNGQRKLFPGFHPGIYLEQHGVATNGADPLADYLRAGQPKGAWNFGLITPDDKLNPLPSGLRIGLHIHAYYPDIFPDILRRLELNVVRPDLLISVTSESALKEVASCLAGYKSGTVKIRIVPNRGRDIAPFLAEFGDTIRRNYDLIGHLHTKKTPDMRDDSIGRSWGQFLLENLLGGKARMADIILGQMALRENVMMVFPDDPNIVGWGKNSSFAEAILSDLGIRNAPKEICFPIGTMFWAKTTGLKALFDLNLAWDDFPEEPLPYDGSLPHALERIFGLVATQNEGTVMLTYVPGVTR